MAENYRIGTVSSLVVAWPSGDYRLKRRGDDVVLQRCYEVEEQLGRWPGLHQQERRYREWRDVEPVAADSPDREEIEAPLTT